jgi:hypothetical protein
VKRLSLLAWIAVCLLSEGPLQAQFLGGWMGDPGVWGRVNPGYGRYPTVSFANDLVILSRQAPSDQTILYDGLFQPLLDASQLGSDSAAGYRFNLTFFGDSGWDLMFDGLFMSEFSSQRTVDSAGGVNLIFYQGLAADPVDTATYLSRLNTGEVNVRRRLSPQLGLLAGIRELQLSEDLNFSQFTANSNYTSQAGNRLFGVQLGAEAVLPARGYGRFFASGKYGVYNDRFRIGAQATSGGLPIHVQVRDDMTSFVGDFNAGFEIQTVPCMTLRFGYQLLWLQDVALAPDQLNQFSIFTNDGTVAKSDPVYHGGFAGLVFTF